MSAPVWRDRTASMSRLASALAARGRAVVGLTGGIGSGKSSVARVLAAEGFEVIDADRITRELSSPGGAAWNEIVSLMDSEDRATWAEKTFQDPELRRRLEAILHPLVRRESERRISSAASPIVVYEAALLIEAGRADDVDALVAVVSDPARQLKRVLARDSRPEAQVRAMIAAQTDNSARTKLADAVIRNDGGPDDLERAARGLAAEFRTLIPA